MFYYFITLVEMEMQHLLTTADKKKILPHFYHFSRGFRAPWNRKIKKLFGFLFDRPVSWEEDPYWISAGSAGTSSTRHTNDQAKCSLQEKNFFSLQFLLLRLCKYFGTSFSLIGSALSDPRYKFWFKKIPMVEFFFVKATFFTF